MNEWTWIETSDFTKLGDRGVEKESVNMKKECIVNIMIFSYEFTY